MKKITALIAAIVLAIITGASSPAQLPEHRNELIIKYKDGAAKPQFGELSLKSPSGGKKPFEVYRFKGSGDMAAFIEKSKNDPSIEYMEPNYIRRACYTPLALPNDNYYQSVTLTAPGPQWGYAIIKADKALNDGLINSSKNKLVVVAVIDTGVSNNNPGQYHEDLIGMTVNGYNVINTGAYPEDDSVGLGHGTHVAGIIAANTNNYIGVAGTAGLNATATAKIRVMPVKALDENGEGTDEYIYSALVWAADNGADIINLSLGGASDSATLRNAVNYAIQKGCIIVAAAGNSDAKTFYPAAYPGVIAVAATDQADARSSFSNYGKIDVSAPGEDITSTSRSGPAQYDTSTGTSFAAPFVSGLMALILLNNDNITPEQARNLLEQTCDDIGQSGYDKYTGWGRINVERALKKETRQVTQLKTYNWPNPFSPERDITTNITFILDSAADVTVTIYDAGGDSVWDRKIAGLPGYNTIKWDGKNMDGKKAANGVYFYTVKAPALVGKNKIAITY